jgi:hypothetical protein
LEAFLFFSPVIHVTLYSVCVFINVEGYQ